jgi:hypothetical protein
MKTTVEISEKEIEAVQRLTGARTAEEAVSKAVTTFIREHEERKAMAEGLHGSIPDIMSQHELQRLREQS